MAETTSRSAGRPLPRRSPGLSAKALASVPPEVKITSRRSAPVAAAITDGGASVGLVRKATKRSDWRDVPLTGAV